MSTPRDVTAMYDDGKCKVCGAPWCAYDFHATLHLADGTAVVEMAYGKPDRIVPTSSLPVKDTADDPHPPAPRTPRNARSVYVKSFRAPGGTDG